MSLVGPGWMKKLRSPVKSTTTGTVLGEEKRVLLERLENQKKIMASHEWRPADDPLRKG